MTLVIGEAGQTAQAMGRAPRMTLPETAAIAGGVAWAAAAIPGSTDARVLLAAYGLALWGGGWLLSRPGLWRWSQRMLSRLPLRAKAGAGGAVAIHIAAIAGVGLAAGALAGLLLPEIPGKVLAALAVAAILPLTARRAWTRAHRELRRLDAGIRGEHDVARVLATLSDGVVINNLWIRLPRKRGVEIDHLLVHPRAGFVVVETKRWGGRLEAQGATWTQDTQGERRVRRGPDLQVLTAAQTLERWLWGCGLGVQGLDEIIRPVIVLPGHAQIAGEPAVPVVHISTLARWIDSQSGAWPYPHSPEEIAQHIADCAEALQKREKRRRR